MKKFLLALLFIAGCSKSSTTPTFTLAWSEYPSWSVFGVASDIGLINGKQGEMGVIEKKYNVDIVLKEADYDTCLTLFGSGTVDASCQTNMDSLAPSLGRASVVLFPTSTSVGGDACVAVGFDGDIATFLRNKNVYGLEKSVSQYAFERCLQVKGIKNESNYKNMDPAAAAQAMQTGQAKIEAIMVWNPFLLQTLRTRPGSKAIFDSSIIPEEIIDCVVIAKSSLEKEGGADFAKALAETFYTFSKMLQGDDNLYVALGAKFSKLSAEDMKLVCKQTRFYNKEDALKLFNSDTFQNKTMPMIVDFCETNGMVKTKPTVGFNQDAQLKFTTDYLK